MQETGQCIPSLSFAELFFSLNIHISKHSFFLFLKIRIIGLLRSDHLSVLMALIASIITFSKKKKNWKKKCYPRPSTWYPRPRHGTLDPRQKDRLSEDDLRSRIVGTFVVKFLACLPLLGFSSPPKMV